MKPSELKAKHFQNKKKSLVVTEQTNVRSEHEDTKTMLTMTATEMGGVCLKKSETLNKMLLVHKKAHWHRFKHRALKHLLRRRTCVILKAKCGSVSEFKCNAYSSVNMLKVSLCM